MQTTKWELYEYQRSRSVIDLGPNHLHSIFLNFFSSAADFNTSSAIRWAIQDQWSSGIIRDLQLGLVILAKTVNTYLEGLDCLEKIFAYPLKISVYSKYNILYFSRLYLTLSTLTRIRYRQGNGRHGNVRTTSSGSYRGLMTLWRRLTFRSCRSLWSRRP